MKKHLHLLFIFLAASTIHAQVPQLWGTMQLGGLSGVGTIIKINGDGTGFTKVYSFTDGSPLGNLLPKDASHLHGMTSTGGTNFLGNIFLYNVGTGGYAIIHSLTSAEGSYPQGSLVEATDNSLYGTTLSGGANDLGVLFRFNPLTFVYTKLHDFDGTATGQNPYGNVLQATNGKLYGMTSAGGANGCGTIFSYDLNSSTFTNLHDFTPTTGFTPFGNLIEASDGLLYGMASIGGSTTFGVIFSLDPSTNAYTLLHTFAFTEGATPIGSLLQVDNGLMYGMTTQGGANSVGTLFSFSPSGNAFTKLHDFTVTDGGYGVGTLIQASDGKLYGMTEFGGTNNTGVIFSYNISSSAYTKIHDCATSTGIQPNADLIEYSGTSGIDNPLPENFISLFPDPSEGDITIELHLKPIHEMSLQVSDMVGSKLLEMKITQPTVHLQLDYPPGIYLLSISDNDRIAAKKIMIR